MVNDSRGGFGQECHTSASNRLGELFDARDAEAFAALYTEDAVLVQIDGKEIRTHDKFIKSVRNMPLRGDGFHKMLETEIAMSGDTARGRCRFEARSVSGALLTGHYEDDYRKTPQGWKFTRRAVFLDP